MDSIQLATSSGVQLKQAGTGLQPVTFSHSPPPKYWQPVSVRTSDKLLSKPGGTAGASSTSATSAVGPKNCCPVSLGSSAGTFSQLPTQKYFTFSGDAMSTCFCDVTYLLFYNIITLFADFLLFVTHFSADESPVVKGRGTWQRLKVSKSK